ncbi:MAG: hypothetical protein K9K67_07125 [Bacteriovoracaceae bacterium]|nr:hypothetical protein [Bacteriovoracaceae bacterium]
MKWTLKIFLLFSLVSCAFFTRNPKDRTFEFLTGKGVEAASPEQFEKALARTTYMAGGNYQISAFPYTESYLKSLAKNHTHTRGLTPIESQKYLKSLQEKFSEGKTCFKFRYEVLRFNQSAELKNWQIILLDKTNQEFPLTWRNGDLEKAPVMTRVLRSGDNLEQWLGDGVACTNAEPHLNSGFGLKVKPSYVQFPFDSTAEIYWEFPEIKIVNGKEVQVEKKKKAFKSYRGW